MELNEIIEELLTLLESRQVSIRKVPMGGDGGGLCMVRGYYIFFLDIQEEAAETAAKAVEAVNKLVDVEKVYIKPEVRDFIERQGQ